MNSLNPFFIMMFIILISSCNSSTKTHEDAENHLEYSTYDNFGALVAASKTSYVETKRITSPGTKDQPTDHGFWFYNCMHKELLQFDPSGRYMLVLRVFFEGRDVEATDRGEIGIYRSGE